MGRAGRAGDTVHPPSDHGRQGTRREPAVRRRFVCPSRAHQEQEFEVEVLGGSRGEETFQATTVLGHICGNVGMGGDGALG